MNIGTRLAALLALQLTLLVGLGAAVLFELPGVATQIQVPANDRDPSSFVQSGAGAAASPEHAHVEVTADTRRKILAGSAAALILSAAFGLLTIRTTVRPLQSLEASVKQMAGGDCERYSPWSARGRNRPDAASGRCHQRRAVGGGTARVGQLQRPENCA